MEGGDDAPVHGAVVVSETLTVIHAGAGRPRSSSGSVVLRSGRAVSRICDLCNQRSDRSSVGPTDGKGAHMICALTVRHLKPGTFERFREAFMGDMREGTPPEGWVRFNMVRGADDPDEVVCFGFYDGSLDDLRAQDRTAYDAQMERIAPYVESVGTDGFFEVTEHLTRTTSAA
jgi:heme-degrading monooxygenase HmoA